MDQKQKPIQGKCTLTDVEVKENEYTWMVKNFSHCCKAYEELSSPEFTTGENDQFHWKIIMDLADNLVLNLRVQLIEDSYTEFKNMYVSLSLLANDDREKFTTKLKNLKHDTLSVKKSFVLNKNSHLLLEDLLTIQFKVYSCSHSDTTQIIRYPTKSKNDSSFAEDFESLVNNKNSGDVKIIVQDRSLYAPKSLLSACSPVFSKFFADKNPKEEHITISIDDFSYEVVLEILRFMYQGRVNNVENLALSLYTAACNYEIENLKPLCDQTIFKGLNLENVSRILILADRYKIDRLKTLSINFLKKNRTEVMKNRLLKLICPNVSPGLVIEVIDELKNHDSNG